MPGWRIRRKMVWRRIGTPPSSRYCLGSGPPKRCPRPAATINPIFMRHPKEIPPRISMAGRKVQPAWRPGHGSRFVQKAASVFLSEKLVRRARQAEMLAQRRAFIVLAEQPAPLQLRHHHVDELVQP